MTQSSLFIRVRFYIWDKSTNESRKEDIEDPNYKNHYTWSINYGKLSLSERRTQSKDHRIVVVPVV